jgi:hypothetical protein
MLFFLYRPYVRFVRDSCQEYRSVSVDPRRSARRVGSTVFLRKSRSGICGTRWSVVNFCSVLHHFKEKEGRFWLENFCKYNELSNIVSGCLQMCFWKVYCFIPCGMSSFVFMVCKCVSERSLALSNGEWVHLFLWFCTYYESADYSWFLAKENLLLQP